MGDVVPFPAKRRAPLTEIERATLKNSIMGLLEYEAGVHSVTYRADFERIHADTDVVIAMLFGKEFVARQHVWRWLWLWGEVSLLSDVVHEEAAPLKVRLNSIVDALFDRDTSVDSGGGQWLMLQSRCLEVQKIELQRTMVSDT